MINLFLPPREPNLKLNISLSQLRFLYINYCHLKLSTELLNLHSNIGKKMFTLYVKGKTTQSEKKANVF